MPTLNRGPAEIIAFPLRGRFRLLPDDANDTRATPRVPRL